MIGYYVPANGPVGRAEAINTTSAHRKHSVSPTVVAVVVVCCVLAAFALVVTVVYVVLRKQHKESSEMYRGFVVNSDL